MGLARLEAEEKTEDNMPTRLKGWVRIQSTKLLTALALVLAMSLSPALAFACGGFFCSLQQRVDQTGEQIVFSVNGTKISAHIQIQYQGEAEDFSWVLPMPSTPELGVGTDQLFSALRAATDPRFELRWMKNPTCDFKIQCEDCWMEDGDFAEGAGGGNEPNAPSASGVEILDEGAVGPFDYQVVSSEDGSAMFTWLNENDYDQPVEAEELITHYVDQEFVFLALKLQKSKSTGDLQPIIVNYEAPNLACIPLKLTSISAQPDLPVFTWILAGARAIPMNFFHVVLNAKAFDWLGCAQPREQPYGSCWRTWLPWNNQDCQQSYMDLVTAAADSANGHGFVTEYAGNTELMKERIYVEGLYDTEQLKKASGAVQFLNLMLQQGFPRTPLVQEIIKKYIPKPENVPSNCQSDQAFYTWNLSECLTYMPEGWEFDSENFADELQDRVIKPLIDAQALFDKHPYMTRVFTTISPEEMTKDPIFSFNADLKDVSNEHQAEAMLECSEEDPETAIAATLTFGDSSQITIPGSVEQDWCEAYFQAEGSEDSSDEPAAADIQIMNEEGAPTSVDPEDVEYEDQKLDYRAPSPNQSEVEQKPREEEEDDPKDDRERNTGTFGTPEGAAEATDSEELAPASGGAPNINPGTTEKKSSGGMCSASPYGDSSNGGALLLILALLALKSRFTSRESLSGNL